MDASAATVDGVLTVAGRRGGVWNLVPVRPVPRLRLRTVAHMVHAMLLLQRSARWRVEVRAVKDQIQACTNFVLSQSQDIGLRGWGAIYDLEDDFVEIE